MKGGALLLVGLLATTASNAQDTAGRLDLAVPQAPLTFRDPAAAYRNDPPGTYYGDHPVENGEWQVHGSVSAGIGWSSHGGNSNWQEADVNMARTYTDDDGDTSHINLNLRVGQGEGPIFGRSYFAPGPYGPVGW